MLDGLLASHDETAKKAADPGSAAGTNTRRRRDQDYDRYATCISVRACAASTTVRLSSDVAVRLAAEHATSLSSAVRSIPSIVARSGAGRPKCRQRACEVV